MIHRRDLVLVLRHSVVNCFQISTLVDDSQEDVAVENLKNVVNCFQISTLVDDSQGFFLSVGGFGCCELLSDFYFSR